MTLNRRPGPGGFFRRSVETIREFLYGFFLHGLVAERLGRKAELEDLFMLANFGPLIGLPIYRSYYSLRLLPYLIPRLGQFKTRIVREKDFFEQIQEG